MTIVIFSPMLIFLYRYEVAGLLTHSIKPVYLVFIVDFSSFPILRVELLKGHECAGELRKEKGPDYSK